jgi:hypothetical protein
MSHHVTTNYLSLHFVKYLPHGRMFETKITGCNSPFISRHVLVFHDKGTASTADSNSERPDLKSVFCRSFEAKLIL